MPTTYSPAPTDLLSTLTDLRRRYHADLDRAGVTIRVLMAANPDGDALRHHGYPALALVKINNLRDRAAGLDDATMLVDAGWWKDASDEEREAVLDHELTRIEVKKDDGGNPVLDDCERPKLGKRPCDFFFSGFTTIAKRYGAASQEHRAAQQVQEHWLQPTLEFAGAGVGDDAEVA